MVFMFMKKCIQCNIEKNELQFNINGRNGYRNLRCKICQANNRKGIKPVKVETELSHKTCKVCNINRLIKYFWKNAQYKDGYDSRCKICRGQGRKQNRNNTRNKLTPKHLQSFEQMVNLRAVTKEDFMDMWKFLETIGYDVKSNKSVHEQFVDKWNASDDAGLHYKNKNSHNVAMYLYDGSINPEYLKYKKHLK